MPRARLSIKSNEGLIALSEAHPAARFTVLGAWPRNDYLRILVKTGDLGAESLVATVENSSLLENLDVHYEGIEQVRFEVDTPPPAAHGAMADSGAVPPFPLTLEGGWLTGEFATSRAQLAAFHAEFEAGDIPYDVMLVETQENEPETLLTERQREVVETALSEGYYDYPRKCTNGSRGHTRRGKVSHQPDSPAGREPSYKSTVRSNTMTSLSSCLTAVFRFKPGHPHPKGNYTTFTPLLSHQKRLKHERL